jgi:hypothetical protein
MTGMRILRRMQAAAFGYFWQPCPQCGRPFSGREWDGTARPSGRGVCPSCASAIHATVRVTDMPGARAITHRCGGRERTDTVADDLEFTGWPVVCGECSLELVPDTRQN